MGEIIINGVDQEGNVIVAAEDTTENNIPQWGSLDRNLKNGLTLNTSVDDPGVDTELVTGKAVRDAVDTLGDKTVKATYFAEIASGTTTGTITKPAGATATLVMDEWGTATDAVLSTIENGRPTFESPLDSSGDPITTTFNTDGEYAFSATPSPAAAHAIVYVYTCKLSAFLATESLWESELSGNAVLTTDFDATSFMYATSKNTPENKTPAETMAILSGTATAEFLLNTQKIGGVVDPTTDQQVATKKYVDDEHDTVIPATQVEVLESGTATYDDTQDYINQFGQRTKITGIDMSNNYDGTIAVSAGTAWCKTSSDINATGAFFDFAGGDSDDVGAHALTDMSTNYIYLDYNGGSPQIVHDDTGAMLGLFDHIVLGQAYRSGNLCHILNADETGLDIGHKTKLRLFQENGATRVSGIVTSSTGTRNLAITAGAFWMGLTRIISLSFDTSSVTQGTATSTESYYLNDTGASFTANDINKTLKNTTSGTEYTDVVEVMSTTRLRIKHDIFLDTETYDMYDGWDSWYTSDSGSTWTQTEHVTQVDNTQYNDITSGLSALTAAARYAVHWLYLDLEGEHLHMVYGQGNYTAVQAELAAVPSALPNIASGFGIIIAKIIVQKDLDVLTITYPWTSAFSSSLATDHGSLAGLLDDDHTQYVKDSEYTQNSGILVGTGAGAFAEETGATLRTSIGVAIGTDVLAEQTIGIANDNLVEMDDAGPAQVGEYVRLTANGLEGRTDAEVKEDLDLEIGTDILAQQTVGIANDNLVEMDDAGPAQVGEYVRLTANGLEGRTDAEVKEDLDLEIGTDILAEQTVGIADDNLLEVDGSPADDDYARFTTTGLEGRTFAEMKSDHSIMTDLSDDTTPDLGGNLTVGEFYVQLDSALSADGKYSGLVAAGVIGYASAAFGELVYLATGDGRWEKTDADAEATAGDVELAMVISSGSSDGDACVLLKYGYIREDDWNWTSPGDALYVDVTTAGGMTIARPSGNADIVRVVGYQQNQVDTILFDPAKSWVEVVV